MGVIQAHAGINQIKNFNTVSTTQDFSVAEYYYEEGKNSVEPFSHNHLEYEFVIPLKTVSLLIYDKANYIGEVGYIYPINPNVEHGLVFPLDKSALISITISKEYVEAIKKKLNLEDKYFYTRFPIPPTFLDGIRDYQNEFSKAQYNTFKVENLIRIITTTLCTIGLNQTIDNRRPEKKYRKNIKNMIQYMYLHYMEPDLDIQKLAELSGYSLAYFTKAFKAYMHDTPIVHLNKLRISEAKAIILSNNQQFSSIYQKVGYKNLSSFTEAFKRVTGLTPTEYKSKYQK